MDDYVLFPHKYSELPHLDCLLYSGVWGGRDILKLFRVYMPWAFVLGCRDASYHTLIERAHCSHLPRMSLTEPTHSLVFLLCLLELSVVCKVFTGRVHCCIVFTGRVHCCVGSAGSETHATGRHLSQETIA